MYTGKAKVSAKGWIVIPKELRDAMGLGEGDEVQLFFRPSLRKDSEYSSSLSVFRAPSKPRKAAAGKFKHLTGDRPITEELVEEHRREVERDERDWRRKRRTTA